MLDHEFKDSIQTQNIAAGSYWHMQCRFRANSQATRMQLQACGEDGCASEGTLSVATVECMRPQLDSLYES
jgi:hypothetical protein